MASFSAMRSFNCSVLGHSNGNPMLAFRNQTSPPKAKDSIKCQFMPKWNPRSKTKSLHMERVEPCFAISGGGSYGDMKNDDEYKQDSFWLEFCNDISYITRSLKTFFTFLVEQPGQFKYIEWPTFQHTLRTAILTLVLVAMLIVALASVDFALAYVLALLTRKPA